MLNILTQEQVLVLKTTHRGLRDKKLADRIKAMLCLNRGFSYSQTAELLLLDETTLRRYVGQYRNKGVEGLLELGYKGSTGELTSIQEHELAAHLDVHLFSTVKEISAYVKKTYGVPYFLPGLTHLLHRLGFVYKKTKLVPGKADPMRQQAFLATYRKLQQETGEQDSMYFVDATHPVHNTRPGNGWILKGKDKLIPTNTGRDRLNLYGALNAETKKVVVLSQETVNFQSAIALSKKLLIVHSKGKIHLILDQASYHKSKDFKVWAKKHRRVKLHFLPPYSPNLNLIERLWGFMHRKVLYNHYYEKFSQFEHTVINFFKHLHRYRKELDSLLTDSFQTLPTLQLQT